MFSLNHIQVSPFDERTAPSGLSTAQSLAAAATRLLLSLNHETPDQAAYDQELEDSEISLCAQLQAEEFVPSDWVMTVEYDQMPETENLVPVLCGPPSQPTEADAYVWLQVDATTGAVTLL